MASLLRPGEHAFAADLFDIGRRSDGDSVQLASFLASGKKLGIPIDRDMIFAGSSHALRAENIVGKAGTLRFVNIDGGHLLGDVEADAELAKNTIADFGVLCFDDFCNPAWPEVSLGVFNFLRANSRRFAAFALSQKKIFICQNEYFDLYKSILLDALVLRRIRRIEVELLGRSVIHFRNTYFERIRFEGLARTGLGRLNAFFY
jgi:hypothetical protein